MATTLRTSICAGAQLARSAMANGVPRLHTIPIMTPQSTSVGDEPIDDELSVGERFEHTHNLDERRRHDADHRRRKNEYDQWDRHLDAELLRLVLGAQHAAHPHVLGIG